MKDNPYFAAGMLFPCLSSLRAKGPSGSGDEEMPEGMRKLRKKSVWGGGWRANWGESRCHRKAPRSPPNSLETTFPFMELSACFSFNKCLSPDSPGEEPGHLDSQPSGWGRLECLEARPLALAAVKRVNVMNFNCFSFH